jgi:hypothetical protein
MFELLSSEATRHARALPPRPSLPAAASKRERLVGTALHAAHAACAARRQRSLAALRSGVQVVVAPLTTRGCAAFARRVPGPRAATPHAARRTHTCTRCACAAACASWRRYAQLHARMGTVSAFVPHSFARAEARVVYACRSDAGTGRCAPACLCSAADSLAPPGTQQTARSAALAVTHAPRYQAAAGPLRGAPECRTPPCHTSCSRRRAARQSTLRYVQPRRRSFAGSFISAGARPRTRHPFQRAPTRCRAFSTGCC